MLARGTAKRHQLCSLTAWPGGEGLAVYGEATQSSLGKRNSEQDIKSELRELTERVRTLRQELEEMTARGRRRFETRPQGPTLPARRKADDKPRQR